MLEILGSYLHPCVWAIGKKTKKQSNWWRVTEPVRNLNSVFSFGIVGICAFCVKLYLRFFFWVEF